jgi:hypothetical protein
VGKVNEKVCDVKLLFNTKAISTGQLKKQLSLFGIEQVFTTFAIPSSVSSGQ